MTNHSSTAQIVALAAFFAFSTAFFRAEGVDPSPFLGAGALLFGAYWLIPRVERVSAWLAERAADSASMEGES